MLATATGTVRSELLRVKKVFRLEYGRFINYIYASTADDAVARATALYGATPDTVKEGL